MRRQAAGAAVGVALGAVLLGQYPSLSPVTIVQVAVAVRLVASVFQWIATVGQSWSLKIIRRKFKYELDFWFSTESSAKVTALLVFALYVAIGGSVVLVVVNEFDLNEALWLSTYWLADPGGMFDEPPARRVIALIVTIGGLMLSALIVSVIGDNISDQLDKLRSGAVPVVESGHVVILGWTSKTLTICRELAEANPNRKFVICVLANRPKEDMVVEVAEHLRGQLGRTSVVCRTGNVSLLSDLKKVSISTAQSVILLNAREQNDGRISVTQEHETACIALRLKQLIAAAQEEDRGLAFPNIVIEVMDRDIEGCIQMLGIPNCSTVFTSKFTGQMMVNFATSPGLHQVITELTSFRGVEVYIVSSHTCGGHTFGEAMFACRGGTVIGIRHGFAKGGAVVLNPTDSTHISANDDLVVITLDRTSCSFVPIEGTSPRRPRPRPRPIADTRRKNYAFVNWRPSLGKMILQMDEMVAPGSTLTLFSCLPQVEQCERLAREGVTAGSLQSLHLRHVTGRSNQVDDLKRLADTSFYTVFVFASEDVPRHESDTAIMPTTLLLTELFGVPTSDSLPGRPSSGRSSSSAHREGHSRPEHFVAAGWDTGSPKMETPHEGDENSSRSWSLSGPSTVECIMCELSDVQHKALFKSIDTRIVPVCADEIAGSAISQVALQPEMKPIFTELLTADGCELYIYPSVHVLGAAFDDDLTWTDVMEACRTYQFIPVGYITCDEEIILNPVTRDVNRKWVSDKFIILAH